PRRNQGQPQLQAKGKLLTVAGYSGWCVSEQSQRVREILQCLAVSEPRARLLACLTEQQNRFVRVACFDGVLGNDLRVDGGATPLQRLHDSLVDLSTASSQLAFIRSIAH